MNKHVRHFVKLITYVLIVMLPNWVHAKQKNPLPKPNIIFLLADDLRYNSLGCMGNKIIKTPNIDLLAKEGTLFKNSFATTPICCVSRASIFSGQYLGVAYGPSSLSHGYQQR